MALSHPPSGYASDPRPQSGQALLDVQNLQTHFGTMDGVVRAVEGLSFHVDAGETVGIVGESGCGKSVTSMSILRLIAEPPGKIAGNIWFEGRDLLTLPEHEMRAVRGNRDLDDLPGADDEPEPGVHGRRADRRTLRLHQDKSRKGRGRRRDMLTHGRHPPPPAGARLSAPAHRAACASG